MIHPPADKIVYKCDFLDTKIAQYNNCSIYAFDGYLILIYLNLNSQL